HNEVDGVPQERITRRARVWHGSDAEALLLQVGRERITDVALIVDEQEMKSFPVHLRSPQTSLFDAQRYHERLRARRTICICLSPTSLLAVEYRRPARCLKRPPV